MCVMDCNVMCVMACMEWYVCIGMMLCHICNAMCNVMYVRSCMQLHVRNGMYVWTPM